MTDDSHILLRQASAVMRQGESVLVALSGGADSVALLAALCRLGLRCVAFHCNYGLRGDESDRDEQHARNIATELRVPIEVLHCDVATYRTQHPGTSIEMACREIRYKAFDEALHRHALDVIAVGHHLEDNIETMLLNLLRGSGIKGLAAMRPRRGNIARPLLACSKADILDFLHSEGLDYVTDSSNLSTDYRRNALRNDIIPLIRKYFPDCFAGMSHTLHALDSQRDFLTLTTEQLLEKYCYRGVIDLRRLSAEHPLPAQALFEILNHPEYRGFNESTVSNMIAAADKSGLKFTGDQCGYLLDHGFLVPQQDSVDTTEQVYSINISNLDSLPPFLHADIITRDQFQPRRDNTVVYFDLDALAGCDKIILRHPHVGDRLQPWSMKGSRLLSDIFTDLHMPHAARKTTWVLEADGKILWVAGIRASRHCPVTSTTRYILRLSFVPL